ncbi:MAG: T9SS type A sorting domain-containing protein [Ferruginibacter sp.]|nr:T9SS type A sorting domain-containing protein [Ferruginibacter sp.]
MKIFTLRLPNHFNVVKNTGKKLPAAFAVRLLMIVVLCLGVGKGRAQIAAWDFTGFGSTSLPTFAATTFNANLVSASGANNITRGSGAAWSTGNNSFRTQGFQNNGISTANTDYFQITLRAQAGFTLSLSTIDARMAGTATFANAPGVSQQFAFSLDGTTFTLIGSPQVTVGTPATLPQIDLTGISALQNVAATTTVTLRYYASGQTATGGWGFNSPSAGQNGLAIGGSLTPAATPTFSFGGTLTTFSTLVGVPSAQQSYTVSGLNLTPNQTNGISVTAPADFEVSLTSNTFTGTNGNTVNLSSNGTGNIVGEPVSVYVRYFPAAPGSVSANIAHSGAGVSPAQNQAVSGVSTAYYYSKSTGDLTDVATWGTATDGTGTSPADFTSSNQSFEIRNRATATITSNWTVSGASSKIIVGNGLDFTIPSANTVTGTVDIQNGGELTLENTTLPTLGTLAGGSTVEYAQTGTVSILNTTTDLVTYSNLKLSNSGLKTFKGSTTTVTGNLTYDGSTNGPLNIEAAGTSPFTTVNLAGNLTYLGAVTNPVDVNSYTLVTNGGVTQTITGNGNTARFFRITNSTAGTNVILSTVGGSTNALVGNATGGGVTIGNATATLSLNGNTLTFFAGNTNVSGAGSIAGSPASNIVINSTSTGFGTLNFTSGSRSLNNLSLTTVSGATLGTALDIYGTVTLTTASLNLNAQNLTLKSNASGTARIADLSGSNLTGATNVTMERYIKLRAGGDGRAYRLLAPTVNTTGNIQANWMEGGMNTAVGTNDNPVPLFGTQITGAGGNANGFDKTLSNASSLYLTTNALVPTYTAVGNTSGTLNALTGYFMYVRGDRSMDMTLPNAPNMPTSSTTLRTTGTLLQGTQTSFTNAYTGGGAWNLVTNPYPSPIDWSLVQPASSGITGSYIYWDANIGTRGGFAAVTTAGVSTPSTSATQIIQTGQAFFVESDGSVPAVSIQETHKVSGNNNGVFLVDPPPVESFRTELYFTEPNGFRRVADGVIALYDNNYSATVDTKDTKEINNWDENIAIDRDKKHLAIETRPVIDKEDDLPIFMNNMKQQAYEFEFTPTAFTNTNLKAELVDNYLNTRTPLSVTAPTVVPFTVTADAASKATDRFKVVFGAKIKPEAGAAPVKTALTVYPNPVQGNNFKVDLTSLAKGNYLLRLYDNTGTIVHSEQFVHDGSQANRSINLKTTIAPGMYQLQVNNEKGFKSSQKIFKQ